MRHIPGRLACLLLLALGCAGAAAAEERRLTIVHTDDLHSHLLGFSPNADYSPLSTGDDATLGGWARIATLIATVRATRDNPVLALDGGDFLMGSLFHTISREEALELRLLAEMGFDATTLGNHEFDLKPDGLAQILETAATNGALPRIVTSNVVFDPSDPRDDRLEQRFRDGLVRPYSVIERDGLRIGIFGLLGRDAAETAPFARPVSFADPTETARRMVATLRNAEKADIVICLCHQGLRDDPSKSEDLQLARAVDGIDVIISGHTDTFLPEPIVENGTVIVHARGYGFRTGVLDLRLTGSGIEIADYAYLTIDDSIAGDPRIQALIDAARARVDALMLAPLGLGFDQVIAETGFDLALEPGESTLGNLVTDAILWAGNRAVEDPADPASRIVVAFQSNGPIRDDILRGRTGKIAVSDLFRVVPLGIGVDGSNGYPLVALHITGAEMKKAFEVLTTLPALKGNDYILQTAGARVTYNPHRMMFDRVTGIEIADGAGTYVPLDTSASNPALYKVVTNIYNATFLKVIGSFTSGILTIVPRDAQGKPIEDLADARIDADPATPGIQEIKEWAALIAYAQSFADGNGNGIPDVPARYAAPEGRQIVAASLNPLRLVAGGNYLTWLAVAALLLAVLLLALVVYLPIRILRRRRLRP